MVAPVSDGAIAMMNMLLHTSLAVMTGKILWCMDSTLMNPTQCISHINLADDETEAVSKM